MKQTRSSAPSRPGLGLAARLVVATLVLGILAAAAGVWIIGATARPTLRAQIESANDALVTRLAASVDANVRSLTSALRLLAGRSTLLAPEPTAGSILASALPAMPALERLTLYDAHGTPVAARARRSLLDLKDLPRLDPVTGATIETASYAVEVSPGERPSALLTVPVFGKRRTLSGALQGLAPFDALAGDIEAVSHASGGVALLLAHDGTVLVSGEQNRVISQEQVDVAALDADGSLLHWAQPTMAFSGMVVIVLPVEVALAPVTSTTWRLTVVLVAVIAAMVLGVSLVTRRFLLPMRDLVSAVQSFHAGNRDLRARDDAPAELGTISLEFNAMADALQIQFDELHANREELLVTHAALREQLAKLEETESALRESEQSYALAYKKERIAAEALREIDRIKNTFLNAVSHELRTPLSSIIGFAETLKDPRVTDPEQQRMMVERIAENGQRLSDLLLDLLDIDRLSRGLVEPRRTNVDLESVVERILPHVPRIAEHELVVDIGVRHANVDIGMVERIVENLVANAAKHTPAGTTIWITTRADGRTMELSVEDDGPGVDPTKQQAIFDAFRRDSPASAPGTGIGLTLVAGFAKLHGGDAWVDSSRHGGAAFRVRFPDALDDVESVAG